jgi:hypothetical protein
MGRLKLFGEPEGDGTNDHSVLSNLSYAQSGHTGFVPSQGEALIEILRLTQNTIRDSGGNNRITFAPTSPHITLAGDLRVTQNARFGTETSPYTAIVSAVGSLDTHPATALYGLIKGTRTSGIQFTCGLYGGAEGQGTPTTAFVYGLYFYTSHATPSSGQLAAIYAQISSAAAGTGPLSLARGLYMPAAAWAGAKPLETCGIHIENQGHQNVANAFGIRLADQSGANVRLLELGPATPYLRLLGGGDPPADKSNLYLKFGSTLYRVVKTGTSMTLEAA